MNFTIVENDILRDEFLKPTQKIVLLVLKSYHNEGKGYSYPSQKTLMQDCCIKDKKTLLNAIDLLEEKGYIKRVCEKGVNNKYFISNVKNPTSGENHSSVENPYEGRVEKSTTSSRKKPHTRNTITNTNTNTIYKDLISAYTENNYLVEALNDFIKMRKTIKKPLTERALKNVLIKLDKIASNDKEKIEILDNSINHCWQGIFELKKEKTPTGIGVKKNNYNSSICNSEYKNTEKIEVVNNFA